MFLLRGAVVSLGVFFLAYVAATVTIACAWRAVGTRCPLRSDTALYIVRMIPALCACALVALFTVPSFLYLEPRFTAETIGAGAFALAVGGMMVVVAGCANTLRACHRTSQFVVLCLRQGRRMKTHAGIPVYEVPSGIPTLFVTGVWRPKLLVSSAALALLEPVEIEAAIRHESAHVNRRDNLKKLGLRCCPAPLLASLEHEWLKATEMAADDAAASDENSALDLAAALVKLSRASTPVATPELAMPLIPETGPSLRTRVERLLDWKPGAHRRSRMLRWLLLGSTMAVLGFHYSWALTQMHDWTELFFR
jgi:Zn-dependent protease with chaperone function